MSDKNSPPDIDAAEYWQYVERIAKQVDAWPDWKKGKRHQGEENPTADSGSITPSTTVKNPPG